MTRCLTDEERAAFRLTEDVAPDLPAQPGVVTRGWRATRFVLECIVNDDREGLVDRAWCNGSLSGTMDHDSTVGWPVDLYSTKSRALRGVRFEAAARAAAYLLAIDRMIAEAESEGHMKNAPTKTSAELMRQLIDALASASSAAADAEIATKEGFRVSMGRVDVEITLALDLLCELRAAGYTW